MWVGQVSVSKTDQPFYFDSTFLKGCVVTLLQGTQLALDVMDGEHDPSTENVKDRIKVFGSFKSQPGDSLLLLVAAKWCLPLSN